MSETQASPNDTIFCAEVARAEEEPLLGTATQAAIWFLLEVRSPWRSKAVTDNDLPPAVQAFLGQQLTAVPDSRLLFIKQDKPGATLRFFVVDAASAPPRQYEIHLHNVEDLLDVNITGLLDGTAPDAANFLRSAPLFLVCCNGTRDKCCAKFGLPAYQALSSAAPQDTWQSTHIGGHRLAPNVLFLPHAVNYGMLTPEETVAAAEAYQNGRLYDLDHYRGRTIYAPAVQAAETYLRDTLQLLELDGLNLEESEALPDGRWRVGFSAPSGARHDVDLLAMKTEPRLVSCSPLAEKPAPRYELLGIEAPDTFMDD